MYYEDDFDYEKEVFRRAMENYEALELEGLAIISFTRFYSSSKYLERLLEAELIAKQLKKNLWS